MKFYSKQINFAKIDYFYMVVIWEMMAIISAPVCVCVFFKTLNKNHNK